MAEQPPVQTHIRKIRIGTPVKRVVGAGIQRLGDLADVDVTGLQDGNLIQYNSSTGRWEAIGTLEGVEVKGGTF
mgnify:CR=1 FL=1|tara:strand:- start:14678 stop:14899 length:222 start_codon:yes stop_codon:yes gene_type:complete